MTKILVVDDDPMIVDGIQALLELHDLESVGVWDCDGAEAALSGEFFPVVLADLRLRTDEDGFRLLESIARISPRSCVATLTGHADAATEARLRAAGSRLVLRKPIGEDELVAAVREMLTAVEEAQRQHGDDLEELYRATRGKLQAIARGRYKFSADEAEDLLQETWLLFLEKRQSVQAPAAWLSGAAANVCRQEIDRRGRQRARSGELTVEPACEWPFDEVVTLRQALDRLDPRARRLCELIAFEERSYEEVAELAGVPLGSVGPLYLRAKSRLRKELSN